jgi:uncharacterized protein YjiK
VTSRTSKGSRRAPVACAIVTALLALASPPRPVMSAAEPPGIFVSEVHPAGSSNGTYNADWFEVTNASTVAVDITGWRFDDDSNSFAASSALNGVTSIAPGQSVVFIDASTIGADTVFRNAWFGSKVPANFTIGTYSGPGLGAGGDAVNLFDASGNRVTGISFGAASPAATFDNASALGSVTTPLPAVTTQSAAGYNGAFVSFNGAETGSPGKRLNSSPLTGIDLSVYVRIGRFDLPEPTRTTPPQGSRLAQEASAVTYNWDTDTLFVVGDGSTSIVQVTKTGELIDSMTLAAGSSPQGTDFFDLEGLAYVGAGRFVMVEERDRQAVLFSYVPGTTLTRATTLTVKLGTLVDNIGLEGISFDPQTGGFIAVKETEPQGIFQTGIDFVAGTATNGSPTTENSINLFDPALANLLDLADVFALSNLQSLTGPDAGRLLVLSQESGKIINIDRSGATANALTITDPGGPSAVVAQGHEGLTMDFHGILYVVSENGGGDVQRPQLWVYAPSSTPNQAPTAVVLGNQINSIVENTGTASRLKVADVVITDDGIGTNNLNVTGTEAGVFEVDSTGLYIKAGTVLDFETKNSYAVTVEVDDPTVGTTPDATAAYSLAITDVLNETPVLVALIVSEVSPWSSDNSPYGVDWFEVTNVGPSAVDLSRWKMDDNSNAFGSAVTLTGISTIASGESVIFMETSDLGATRALFLTAWFGSNPPAGLQVGSYTGAGVGLSTGGDSVNLFDASGNRVTAISVGVSVTGVTFDNAAGLGSTTLPLPTVSALSAVGVNGAFLAVNAPETGSPGRIAGPQPPPTVIISEISPWSSGNSPYAADWFELTNTGATIVDITGWKMDDDSAAFASSVALSGVTSLAPGESVIFLETSMPANTRAAFLSAWFGANPPAGLQIGSYSGGGVGLSTAGDSVVLFDGTGKQVAGVRVGASTSGLTFDNAAGLGGAAPPLPSLSMLSAAGVNGAFLAAAAAEIGSPGSAFLNRPPLADAGPDRTVEATGPGGASVVLDGAGSTDPDGESLSYTWTEGGSSIATGVTPTVTLGLGSHVLTLTADDGKSTDSGTVSITVRDTTAPLIESVTPSPTQLWPPNNGMIPVSVAIGASDHVTPSPACTIASVSSNEPGPDQWQITGPQTLNLEASRNGNGNGRTYRIAVQCSDAAGNVSSGSAVVIVPHDRGNSLNM